MFLFYSVGRDSDNGGVPEAAAAAAPGLLRPLPLQTSIQTLQAVLRSSRLSCSYGPVSDAGGPNCHQHDDPQRYHTLDSLLSPADFSLCAAEEAHRRFSLFFAC